MAVTQKLALFSMSCTVCIKNT